MKHQTLWVQGKMPSLNDILDARMIVMSGKKNRAARGGKYNRIKKQVQGDVAIAAFAQKFEAFERGYFTYLFKETKNANGKQRDPSNILAGAAKMIEDALIECKLLPNDGMDNVLGIAGHFDLTKNGAGVLLIVHPDKTLTREECLAIDMFRGDPP